LNLAAARESARRGQLYPSVILYGADAAARQEAALELARLLLCEAAAEKRPCGGCRHCRRIQWPGQGEAFHPDFQVLERDLKTATSVEGARELLRSAQVSPFEARGQVFVIAAAETLSGEAANALLKTLEEPHVTSPRNFFLLAPSRLDLLPTLRSRSLSLFLGPAERLDPADAARLARPFAAALTAYAESGAGVYLLAAAEALAGKGKDFEDPRAGRPWALAATAVLAALAGTGDVPKLPVGMRQPCLALAEALLEGPTMRLRGVAAERILEGLVARNLA